MIMVMVMVNYLERVSSPPLEHDVFFSFLSRAFFVSFLLSLLRIVGKAWTTGRVQTINWPTLPIDITIRPHLYVLKRERERVTVLREASGSAEPHGKIATKARVRPLVLVLVVATTCLLRDRPDNTV